MAAESLSNLFKKRSVRTVFRILGYALWKVNMNLDPAFFRDLDLQEERKVRRANRSLNRNPKIITSQKTENTLMGLLMFENDKAVGNKSRISAVLFVNKITRVSGMYGH